MNRKITVEIKSHHYSDAEYDSFLLQDVHGIAEYYDVKYSDIVEIDSIVVSDPGKGYGSICLRDYLLELSSSTIVILRAEPIYATEAEYIKAIKSGEFDLTLGRLLSFYTKHNFLNINDHIGYESGVAMIYGNKIGKTIDLCFDKYKADNEKGELI